MFGNNRRGSFESVMYLLKYPDSDSAINALNLAREFYESEKRDIEQIYSSSVNLYEIQNNMYNLYIGLKAEENYLIFIETDERDVLSTNNQAMFLNELNLLDEFKYFPYEQ